jgi:flagellar motor switch protein FliN/FliY
MLAAENHVSPIALPLLAGVADLPKVRWTDRIEEHPAWPSLSRVPEKITALIPLRGFTVRALMRLGKGEVIASDRAVTSDIPVKIGSVQLAWGEFEVVEDIMALRVTRIA